MILQILEELRIFARVFGTKESTKIARHIWKAEKKFMKEYKYITTKQATVFFPEINSNDLFYALKGRQIVGKKIRTSTRHTYLFRTDSVLAWYKRLMRKRGK